ncbi:hypothetical protein GCK32_008884 [Trichostrongylus colubriformis]|uniref:Uncharacterized protein n=1 Tax=Trichostrongylus colubriformis TaxID=6319 RepID=A0AAN8EYP9_TRICO
MKDRNPQGWRGYCSIFKEQLTQQFIEEAPRFPLDSTTPCYYIPIKRRWRVVDPRVGHRTSPRRRWASMRPTSADQPTRADQRLPEPKPNTKAERKSRRLLRAV